MRYFIVTLIAVAAMAMAPDAWACQQCKIDMYGCLQCRETPYNGSQGCEIVNNGRTCNPTGGYCEGWGGEEDCGGSPCTVYEQWAKTLPLESKWQLTETRVENPTRIVRVNQSGS